MDRRSNGISIPISFLLCYQAVAWVCPRSANSLPVQASTFTCAGTSTSSSSSTVAYLSSGGAVSPSAVEESRSDNDFTLTTNNQHTGTSKCIQQKSQEQLQWEDNALVWIDDMLQQKSFQSPFAIENIDDDSRISESERTRTRSTNSNSNAVPFEWVCSDRNFTSQGKDHADVSSTIATTDIIDKKAPRAQEQQNIAIRTMDTPLLDTKSIASIRTAAHLLWSRESELGLGEENVASSSSRFTLQFADTNSECHLDDLVASDETGDLKGIVDNLLTTKIYPLVREAFGSSSCSDDQRQHQHCHLTAGNLCVYDSLVVRYNGDMAKDNFGASQPLHRDGGVVSVNIALNPHEHGEYKDNENEDEERGFIGGGTFFEDLLADNGEDGGGGGSPILRPTGTGHAVAHLSTKRHAGAPTTSGIREILVFFLTQRGTKEIKTGSSGSMSISTTMDTNTNTRASTRNQFPAIERAFHLKMKSREMQGRGALVCLDLAIQQNPNDGEAHFLKGSQLMRGGNENYASNNNNESQAISPQQEHQQRWEEIHQSLHHLNEAKELSSYDARVNFFAGLAYKQRLAFIKRTGQMDPQSTSMSDCSDSEEGKELEETMRNLQRAVDLYGIYQNYGISSDFDSDIVMAILTLGEVYIQMDRYSDAIQCIAILSSEDNLYMQRLEEDNVLRLKKRAQDLIEYCEDQLKNLERMSPLS